MALPGFRPRFLGVYYNTVQPLNSVYDAFLLTIGFLARLTGQLVKFSRPADRSARQVFSPG